MPERVSLSEFTKWVSGAPNDKIVRHELERITKGMTPEQREPYARVVRAGSNLGLWTRGGRPLSDFSGMPLESLREKIMAPLGGTTAKQPVGAPDVVRGVGEAIGVPLVFL
jgi:hypothetical protein